MRDDTGVTWDDLVEHRERLLRIARRRLPLAADAEDCVHEAMLRAAGLPDVAADRVGPLLTTITVRLCVDWQRRHTVANRAIARYGGRRDVAADPIEELIDRAEATSLRAAVDRLADTERAVMLARADGQTVSETARRLGITYKAVECAYTRARRKLRVVLAGVGPGLATFRRNGRWAATAATPVALVVALGSGLLPPEPFERPRAATPRPAPETGVGDVARPEHPVVAVRTVAAVAAAPPAPRPAVHRTAPAQFVQRPLSRTPDSLPVGVSGYDPREYQHPVEWWVMACATNGVDVDVEGDKWGVLCRETPNDQQPVNPEGVSL